MNPAGDVEDPRAPQSHLRVSHSSLDGHTPPTGSTGPAAVFLNKPLTAPLRAPGRREVGAHRFLRQLLFYHRQAYTSPESLRLRRTFAVSMAPWWRRTGSATPGAGAVTLEQLAKQGSSRVWTHGFTTWVSKRLPALFSGVERPTPCRWRRVKGRDGRLTSSATVG